MVRARPLLPRASALSVDAAVEVPAHHADLVSAAVGIADRGRAFQPVPSAGGGASGDDECRIAGVARVHVRGSNGAKSLSRTCTRATQAMGHSSSPEAPPPAIGT